VKSLDISGCTQLVTPEVVEVLQQNAPNLSSLKLNECENLTDGLVQTLMQQLPSLSFISCEGCAKLCDLRVPQSLDHVRPVTLTSVNLSGCRKLSSSAIRRLTCVAGMHLRTVNLSGTGIDCMALVYLSGYSLSAAVNLATNTGEEGSKFPIIFKPLQDTEVSNAYSVTHACDEMVKHTAISEEKKAILFHGVKGEGPVGVTEGKCVDVSTQSETVSTYVKRMCAYCSTDLAVRNSPDCSHDTVPNSSDCIDSITLYSINESNEEYDIINSHVVNIIETNQSFEVGLPQSHNDDGISTVEQKSVEDLDWAVLSLRDIQVDVNEKCAGCGILSTCTSERNMITDATLRATAGCTCYSEGNSPLLKDTLHLKTADTTSEGELCKCDSEYNCDRCSGISEDEEKLLVCEQVYVPNITSLDISNTNFFDSEFYSLHVVQKCFELFQTSNSGNLKVFSISWSSEYVSDDMIRLIGANQTNIESLSLAGCTHITNSGILDIVHKLERLRAVDLSGVSFVTDEPLIQLVTRHSDLQYISLAESCLSDKVLHAIADVLYDTIHHLDLSWCENVTDEGVSKVLSSCHRLTYLDLRQCEVSAVTIKGVMEQVTNLSMLGLSGIKGLNDTTCTQLICKLPYLKRIDLSWNCSLTDESITLMCCSCPMLRELIISGLKRITSKPFLPIVAGWGEWRKRREEIKTRLRRPCVSTNVSTRERDILQLEPLESDFYVPYRSVNFVPRLSKLTLGYCDKVNDNDLAEIVAVCRGTLAIEDYYGVIVEAKWSDMWKRSSVNQGRLWKAGSGSETTRVKKGM